MDSLHARCKAVEYYPVLRVESLSQHAFFNVSVLGNYSQHGTETCGAVILGIICFSQQQTYLGKARGKGIFSFRLAQLL